MVSGPVLLHRRSGSVRRRRVRGAGHRLHRTAARQRLVRQKRFQSQPDRSAAPPPGLDGVSGGGRARAGSVAASGSGSISGVDDSAFLVRLRRSNEFQDLAGQTEPNVGSSGPSLPLTFGKATTISRRRSDVGLLGSTGWAHRPGHGDSDGSAGHARRSSAGQPGSAGRDAICAASTRAFSRPTGARGHDHGDDQSGHRSHHAHAAPARRHVPPGAVVGRFVGQSDGDQHGRQTRSRCARRRAVCAAATSFAGQYGPVYSLMASGRRSDHRVRASHFHARSTCAPRPGAPLPRRSHAGCRSSRRRTPRASLVGRPAAARDGDSRLT